MSTAWLMGCAIGCSDHVDLGGSPPNPPPDSDAGADDGSLATLLRFDDSLRGCDAIAVDDTYLYFSTVEQNDGSLRPSVHRCRKTNCRATVTRVTAPLCASCVYASMDRMGDQLALSTVGPANMGGFAHVAACTAPDCHDIHRVVGEFASIEAIAFAGDQMYFSIIGDRTIYGCSFPSCGEGPHTFVRGPSTNQLTTDRDWMYWVDRTVRRTRLDGSSAPEELNLGAVLGPATDGGAGPGASIALHSIAAEDGWLYDLIFGSSEPDLACEQHGDTCVIARWPDDTLGQPRQLVYRSPAPIDHNGSPIRIFDRELVFSAGPTGQTYSCDASNCEATVRPLASVKTGLMTSDHDHLYWCTQSSQSNDGEIQRIARILR